ncbi:MAG: hypothetical protein R3E14_04090 [Erythrobacter sp.]
MSYNSKLVILAGVAALCVSAPAAAQEADPFTELVEALASTERLMSGYADGAAAAMIEEARRDPEMLEMEEECPGTLELMGSASRPMLEKSHLRAVGEYRANLLALFRDKLEPEIAGGAAEFYRSDDGQFVIRLAEENESVANTLAAVRENPEGDLSREAFEADKAASREALKSSEHKGRMQKIGWGLATSSWFSDFRKIQPEMHELEFALLNDDFTPEEEAAFDHVLEKALTGHFEQCYAE